MSKNYFTDEQVKAIHKEICRLEDLDSGISMPFQPLNHIEIANLRRIMNLAVEAAIGEPYLHVDYSKIQNVNWIKVNNFKDNTPLYSVKELEN